MSTEAKQLTEVWERSWATLSDAALSRDHPWRTPSLATTDEVGAPDQRMVVLRAVDGTSRKMTFHSDVRANKIKQLSQNSSGHLLFWDPVSRIQLRAKAIVSVHVNDDIAHEQWRMTATPSRTIYGVVNAPGTKLAAPQTMLPESLKGSDISLDVLETCQENFAVICASIIEMQWLEITRANHTRAQISWDSNGDSSTSWIAP